MWRKDGKELFYLSLDGKLMAVPIETGTTLEPGIPQSLFQTGINAEPTRDQFAVSADGQRFLLSVDRGGGASAPITVVLNWTAGVKK